MTRQATAPDSATAGPAGQAVGRRPRRPAIRFEAGPELVYVQRDGQVALLGRFGIPEQLDALDRHFLQALCLHVLSQLDPHDHDHADGQRLTHPVILQPNVISSPAGDWR